MKIFDNIKDKILRKKFERKLNNYEKEKRTNESDFK